MHRLGAGDALAPRRVYADYRLGGREYALHRFGAGETPWRSVVLTATTTWVVLSTPCFASLTAWSQRSLAQGAEPMGIVQLAVHRFGADAALAQRRGDADHPLGGLEHVVPRLGAGDWRSAA